MEKKTSVRCKVWVKYQKTIRVVSCVTKYRPRPTIHNCLFIGNYFPVVKKWRRKQATQLTPTAQRDADTVDTLAQNAPNIMIRLRPNNSKYEYAYLQPGCWAYISQHSNLAFNDDAIWYGPVRTWLALARTAISKVGQRLTWPSVRDAPHSYATWHKNVDLDILKFVKKYVDLNRLIHIG